MLLCSDGVWVLVLVGKGKWKSGGGRIVREG